MLSSGRGEDRRGGGRGRNKEYDNDEDNDERIIHVRRKVIDVGGASKDLGTTGSDQLLRLPNNKDKDADKNEDDRPSPPLTHPF